jgi:mannose/fructose/sorbose-specific phosphotransferase system IIA component
VIGILIVTHGMLAEGLLDSATMILGPIPNISAIKLDEKTTPQALEANICDQLSELRGEEGVVILTDLLGATPYNVSAKLANDEVLVITGVNLPLLLEAITTRNGKERLSKFADDLISKAQESIVNVNEMLRQHQIKAKKQESKPSMDQF